MEYSASERPVPEQPSLEFPAAVAHMSGNGISGSVSFYDTRSGVFVIADIHGLPAEEHPYGVFGFHIHEGTACMGVDFADTGGHLNLTDSPHPYHTGDLPPLFSNHGNALMAVRTGRFKIADIIGRTVIIHSHPDDFTTQPAGHSGKKIGCGVIRRV